MNDHGAQLQLQLQRAEAPPPLPCSGAGGSRGFWYTFLTLAQGPTISGCRALHATKRVMRPSPQTAIVCCGERSPEGGCPSAVRLSASCSVTRVAQRERLLKQSWPERALGARVRDAPGFSPCPLAVADRRTAAESEHRMRAPAQLAATASRRRPTAVAQRLGLARSTRSRQQVGCSGVAALAQYTVVAGADKHCQPSPASPPAIGAGVQNGQPWC